MVNRFRWRWRFRAQIKKENSYIDSETKKKMYRGPAYCLSCREPVLEFGKLCPECDVQDNKLVGVP